MTGNQAILQTLRDAVAVSPENVPLRQHLADMLLQADQYTEAENEYRAALDLMARQGDKRNVNKLRAGLVEALAGQGKSREAMTLLTSLFQSINPIPGELYLLHARLLLQTGEKARAIGEYLRALDSDAVLADPKLAAQLGLQPDNLDPDFVPPPAPPEVPTQPAPVPVAPPPAPATPPPVSTPKAPAALPTMSNHG